MHGYRPVAFVSAQGNSGVPQHHIVIPGIWIRGLGGVIVITIVHIDAGYYLQAIIEGGNVLRGLRIGDRPRFSLLLRPCQSDLLQEASGARFPFGTPLAPPCRSCGTGAVGLPHERSECFGCTWQPVAAAGRDRESTLPIRKKATPNGVAFLRIRSLAMTYSHMGKPHTTIGDASFHF